jgi:hypothetical protein
LTAAKNGSPGVAAALGTAANSFSIVAKNFGELIPE